MFRNRWTVCSGMGGHNGAEWLDSYQRNDWSLCGGIRTDNIVAGAAYSETINNTNTYHLLDPLQSIGMMKF